MSFISAWNEDLDTLAGLPLDLLIHNHGWLSAAPFVQPHPSGFFQTIRYEPSAAIFSRRILYPIEEAAAPCASLSSVASMRTTASK